MRERIERVLRGSTRVTTALIVLALIGVWLQYHVTLAQALVVDLHMNDFGKFYYSAQRFLDGGDPYGPSPATLIPVGPDDSRQFWNLNPPHFHLLMLPLARLAEMPALVAWAIASLVGLIASARIIAVEVGLRWTLWGVLLTTLAIVSSSATGALVLTGQMTFLLLFVVTLAWRAARHDRWMQAAMWLGAIAGIKPLFGVFLFYLLGRRMWRPAAGMTVSAAAGFLVGLAAFGWPAHVAWARAVAAADWPWAMMNGSLLGLFSRTLAPSPYFTPLADWPAAVVLFWVAASAAVVLVAARTLWHARTSVPGEADAAFAVLTVAALLVSPMGWIYYLPLAAGPLLALWLERRTEPAPWSVRNVALALAAPGLVCPVGAALLWRQSAAGTLTLGSIFAWSMLWLGVALAAHLSAAEAAPAHAN